MHFSTAINPVSLLWGIIMSVGSLLIYRRIDFNSQRNTIEVMGAELKVYKEQSERVEKEQKQFREKDRINESRMMEIEFRGNRADLRHEFDREENEALKEIVFLCMAVIMPLANGNKTRIEAKMADLARIQVKARQSLIDYDDKARLFRTYTVAPD